MNLGVVEQILLFQLQRLGQAKPRCKQKSADSARKTDGNKAAERLAFFKQQRGLEPAKPAKCPPVRRKKK